MGSSRSISSHCDPKTLVAIDLAFDGAWDVLEARELAVAGSAAMYHAMTSMGFASECGS